MACVQSCHAFPRIVVKGSAVVFRKDSFCANLLDLCCSWDAKHFCAGKVFFLSQRAGGGDDESFTRRGGGAWWGPRQRDP